MVSAISGNSPHQAEAATSQPQRTTSAQKPAAPQDTVKLSSQGQAQSQQKPAAASGDKDHDGDSK